MNPHPDSTTATPKARTTDPPAADTDTTADANLVAAAVATGSSRPSVEVSRRAVVTVLSSLGLAGGVFARALLAQTDDQGKITAEMIRQAEWIADLQLTDQQREKLANGLQKNRQDLARLRAVPCDADIPPAAVFRPDLLIEPVPELLASTDRASDAVAGNSAAASPIRQLKPEQPRPLPTQASEIAFASLVDQAAWLASGQLSSVELTKLYLERLERFDPKLLAVVTLLRESALEQAEMSDARRAQAQTLGLLDGIPWVAKDLIAVPPFKTTWGAAPYKDQVRETTATVAQRLLAAGGVLLAKVSLGALAWGDIWYGGTTRNPWNPQQGSSGSSAGTCASVVAGLASYGLGSETLGSIVSPCIRCCVSGLRPSFGRVSRYGCMPLAWSFDKIGPIARYIDDLAVVFSHIYGSDGYDPTVVDLPFAWPENKPWNDLVVGTTSGQLSTYEQHALDWLIERGAKHRIIELPTRFPLDAMTVMLNVEATTVFDDILRSDPEADLGLWPDSFRRGQFISAVQYLRASRLRTQLVQEAEAAIRQVDVLLGADDLVLTNLSGHPSIVVALGSLERQGESPRPATVKLTAPMYREATLLQVASHLQKSMPPLSLGASDQWQ